MEYYLKFYNHFKPTTDIPYLIPVIKLQFQMGIQIFINP